MPDCYLVLEDGTVLPGQPFGAAADAVFELVFNTSMTGYQEIITDPSYRGQGVLFTASHIGNVGINLEDDESALPQVEAVVVRSLSPTVSNWRASRDLAGWLAEHGVPGISGVDTRYLTRRLRQRGIMKAALSTRGTLPEQLLATARAWPGLDGLDMVQAVTCAEAYDWTGDAADVWVHQSCQLSEELATLAPHVLLYDFGAKRNIVRHLTAAGLRVTVLPAGTPAAAALAMQPDGVVLSNGPGDPAGLPYAVEATRQLIDAGVPIFGICLGHQLIGRALDGSTSRLKFGHHGGNHPVQDLRTGQVAVTAQNHNYQVDMASLDPAEVEITHLSLNDGSLEGMRLRHKPVFCVQYHPEAAPGPHDSHGLFVEFVQTIRSHRWGDLAEAPQSPHA
ncbi:MAG TPA: glutamine-hydrolyzing carbamoyl-phosphate synthase small subunit [Anaerolineae bacterium]|nr:glutamine-hydrolyzing carbamoyl-phosphate synthase small subunit [Anaerolineae bacterium]